MSTIIVPDEVPSPIQDCERLKEAFRGLGTDEKTIILVLGHRNASQRKKIRETYLELYGENLIDTLYSELSGDFGKAVIWWTYDPPERDAVIVNGALNNKRKGLKYLQTIVEIACSSSPDHLMDVRKAYCSLFDTSLEEDIASSVDPPLRKVLVGLVSSYRYDKEIVDLELADSEASLLYESIKAADLELDNFLFILQTRNPYQLRATFESYKQKFGNTITKDIRYTWSAELEALSKLTVLCFERPEEHFAEVIRASIVGFGTDEDSLTRAIVSRAEIDLMKVKGAYFDIYQTSVENAIKDDTSGDYLDFLMTLLGAKN